MKTWWLGMLLAVGVATAACGTSPPALQVPASPHTTEPVLTIEPTPVLTVTTTPVSSVPSTTSAQAPAGTTKAPVRKTPARKPPRYGYECRDGDELKYDICASHKAWVDGQREFADCLSGGGTWDEVTQRCVRP